MGDAVKGIPINTLPYTNMVASNPNFHSCCYQAALTLMSPAVANA